MKEKCNCCNGVDKTTILNELTRNEFYRYKDGNIGYKIKNVPPLYGSSIKEYSEEIMESVDDYNTGDIVSDLNSMDMDFMEYIKHTTDTIKSALDAINFIVDDLNDNVENYKDVKNTRLLLEMVDIVDKK